jgi:hypothetical protein
MNKSERVRKEWHLVIKKSREILHVLENMQEGFNLKILSRWANSVKIDAT